MVIREGLSPTLTRIDGENFSFSPAVAFSSVVTTGRADVSAARRHSP